jgi:hypothetical protein
MFRTVVGRNVNHCGLIGGAAIGLCVDEKFLRAGTRERAKRFDESCTPYSELICTNERAYKACRALSNDAFAWCGRVLLAELWEGSRGPLWLARRRRRTTTSQ